LSKIWQHKVQRPRSSFWFLNGVGWIIVTLINITFQTEYYSTNFDAIGYSFVITSVGFLFTFFIRYTILKFQINEKALRLIIPYLSLLTVISSIACVVVYSLFIELIYPHLSTSLGEIARSSFQFGLLILVWILLYGSILFFENQQKLKEQKLFLSLKLKEAELNNLHKQLSPHFLFNALNNIYALIRVEPEKAREAILNMSDLLRYVLNCQKMERVSVQEEMQIVEAYMDLNRIHLGQNVRFEVDISPSVLDLSLPPLSLQLLVENAIKHGDILNGSLVKIQGYEKKGNQIIQVFNPGQLKTDKIFGIGLSNLQHRLETMYGANAKFEISESKNVVRSQITILSCALS
jgi:two-component system, LytTR family, sensor kinase